MNEGELKFFDPFSEIEAHGFQLPHWQQPGATFFATFRLADSIPQERRNRLKEDRAIWLDVNLKPWSDDQEAEYHRLFSGKIEQWLDEGLGSSILKEPVFRDPLSEVLAKFDAIRYVLHSWVIMPNHVHVLFSLGADEKLEDIMKSWKGVSAKKINSVKNQTGKLWQRNYFDRLIRNSKHFWNVARYIQNNPAKARLNEGDFTHYESDFVRTTLE